MPFSPQIYDPETIAFLDECLNATYAVAMLVPSAHAARDGIDIRHKLALAIIEGFSRGLHQRTKLIDFTLRALPALRAAAAAG
jgi:hypothetical protein